MNNKASMGAGGDCMKIAREQLELSRLYRSVGNTAKSDEVLNDTLKTLEDPMCVQTAQTTRLISAIKSFQSNPNLANAQRMPAIYRYAGLIFLLVGYGVLYVVFDFIKINPNYFLAAILVMFVISIWISSALRRSFIRSVAQSNSSTIDGTQEPRNKSP
ncbi:MAG: hypothetical protein QW597_04140 [Thermoplasmataceae archaeon]